MKIRFFQDTAKLDGTGEDFKSGEVYDLNDASAYRWVRRGLAEYVTESEPKKRGRPSKQKAEPDGPDTDGIPDD